METIRRTPRKRVDLERQRKLTEYAGYLARLQPGQAGKLVLLPGESAVTVRRWLAAAAKTAGLDVTIQAKRGTIYFWLAGKGPAAGEEAAEPAGLAEPAPVPDAAAPVEPAANAIDTAVPDAEPVEPAAMTPVERTEPPVAVPAAEVPAAAAAAPKPVEKQQTPQRAEPPAPPAPEKKEDRRPARPRSLYLSEVPRLPAPPNRWGPPFRR